MTKDPFATLFVHEDHSRHFVRAERELRDLWAKPVRCQDALSILQKTVKLLQSLLAHQKEFNDLHQYASLKAYHARLVPVRQFGNALALIVYAAGVRAVGLGEESKYVVRGLPSGEKGAHKALASLLHALEDVGLGGDRADQAWATATNKLLNQYISQLIAHGESPSIQDAIIKHVEDTLVPWIASFDQPRKQHKSEFRRSRLRIDGPTIDLLKASALNRMGQLKAGQLCENIIRGEEQLSEPDQDFLTQYVTEPVARTYVTKLFTQALQTTVLHSGLSTVHILSTYMRLILTFRSLDPSGVILRNLATPIQSFLRTRTDAVRIVLLSLLESSRDEHGRPKSSTPSFCADIAKCMEDEKMSTFREYFEGMDLEDPNWMPEPVDAETGHAGARNLDAIAHLVTISPREAFIAELQTVLATRLLSRATSGHTKFEPEIALLNLFKQRFEELHIQSCEIMVRDILSSQGLNAEITASLKKTHPTNTLTPKNMFGTLILSKFYWPALQNATFAVPGPIRKERETYDEAFREIKGRRKLEYLDELGRVGVRLEFEDRVFEGEVSTAQATVVHKMGEDEERTWTVPSLAEACGMEEGMVKTACGFWVGQRVLESTKDESREETVFKVLNRLPATAGPSDQQSPPAPPPPPPSATPAIKTPETLLAENKDLYARFVEGMLTNQGAMRAARIHGMMRMVLPGGFPFEEGLLVKGVLEVLEKEGRVEREGGIWRVKRAS